MLTTENFRYSYFAHEHLKAFISEGADLIEGEVTPLYFATLRNESEEKDLMERPFSELTEALHFVNQQYSIMNFQDMRVKAGGGCESCSAH